jgi:nucleoside-diphosphate-sugar epimerase
MKKVLLLGSTGFVGQHLAEVLADSVQLITTTRDASKTSENVIYFDLQNTDTWAAAQEIVPDVIINSAGYGVVKEQTDLAVMYAVNYQLPMKFALSLQKAGQYPLWIQIGTAFEYDLDAGALTEESATLPATHYGISKMLFSNFLLAAKNKLPYVLLRPFAMFGPYESDSKFIPYLINSQAAKKAIPLSSGLQQRDYFYVRDLAEFVKHVLALPIIEIAEQVFNLGTGHPSSIKELGEEIAVAIDGFNAEYWQWGQVPQRLNESDLFFNASPKAQAAGLRLTPRATAIKETVNYYFNHV